MLNRQYISRPNNIGVTARRDTGTFRSFGPFSMTALEEASSKVSTRDEFTILDGRTQEDRDLLECFRNQPSIRRNRVRKGGFAPSH